MQGRDNSSKSVKKEDQSIGTNNKKLQDIIKRRKSSKDQGTSMFMTMKQADIQLV